ncbi:hypothetical protein GBA52_018058 [Prunus armeniaca]|nr:hypothetical protein GBA52_018058 [Prunus armeniaca]
MGCELDLAGDGGYQIGACWGVVYHGQVTGGDEVQLEGGVGSVGKIGEMVLVGKKIGAVVKRMGAANLISY